jgi:hypothetical protein
MAIATQTQTIPTTNKRNARCSKCRRALTPGEGIAASYRYGFGTQTTYICTECNEVAQAMTNASPFIHTICQNLSRETCPLPSVEEMLIYQYLRSKAGKLAAVVAQAVAAEVQPNTNQNAIYKLIDLETVRANCHHTHTIHDIDGGFYLSFGEVTDNITETAFCLDCGAHIVTDHDVAGFAAELGF